MAVNKKSLTTTKSATKPANTKSVKAAAPAPATAATSLRFASAVKTVNALRVTSTKKVAAL